MATRYRKSRDKLNIRVPRDLLDLLRGISVSSETPMNSLAIKAISDFIAKWHDANGNAAEPLPMPDRLWKSGWSKRNPCNVCGECGHDPKVQHPGEEPTEQGMKAVRNISCGS